MVIDTNPETDSSYLDELDSYDEQGSDKRLGTLKPPAFFESIDREVNVDYEFFKPYLTWAVFEVLNHEMPREIEESYVYFKIRPPSYQRVIMKFKELPEEYYLSIPSSVYAKAEHTREEWSKMGNDYDDDYPFKKVERSYEDKNQVGYYYKPTKEEL